MRFDGSFVYILILENFNLGLQILIILCTLDFYKSYLNLEPAEMSIYFALMFLPWSLKVFYGIITDNVKIFGLKRKPYLIFLGFF
jgi:hypothetical protein